MKLAVFGATGGAGRHLLTQALAAGHEVTAFARDASRLDTAAHRGLTVVEANVLEPDEISPRLKDVDAVVSAIGQRRGSPATLCADSVRSLSAAMGPVGVRRLVVVSSAGAFIEPGDDWPTKAIAKPLLRRLLRVEMADFVAMEGVIRATDLDWTIVRPPQLTDKAATGRYRTSVDAALRRAYRVARADLADAVLRTVANPELIHKTVTVAN